MRLPASISNTRRLVDVAARIPALPEGRTTQDMRALAEGVVKAVREGLDICAKDTKGYTYKTVARKVLAITTVPRDVRLTASSDDGSVWDGLKMDELLQWMPDEEDYLKPLEHLTCADARKLFAMPPPWISCFACYMGTLSKAQVAVLQKAKGIDMLLVIEKFRKKYGFAPSIKSVANALT